MLNISFDYTQKKIIATKIIPLCLHSSFINNIPILYQYQSFYLFPQSELSACHHHHMPIQLKYYTPNNILVFVSLFSDLI